MKLTIKQYLDLQAAGYTPAEIAAYESDATDPTPAPAADPAPATAPTPAPVTDPTPAPAADPTPAPAETETQKLLKQMLGLLQSQNIRRAEQPTDTAPDAAQTMAAIWQTQPPKATK